MKKDHEVTLHRTELSLLRILGWICGMELMEWKRNREARELLGMTGANHVGKKQER